MPFVKWTIEPVFLSRQPIPPDKNVTDELEASANSTLVGTLRQLACLVAVADNIFEGIAAECKVIFERSVQLQDKLERCERSVSQLNARAVPIPLGDLTKFSQLKEHYRTRYEHANCLFTPDSRPQRVRRLYEHAAATPALHVIRDVVADDGSGAEDSPRRLFLCMPVWGDASRAKSVLDIETRRPASLVTAGQDARDSGGEEPLILPSPEEKMHALSLEYPPVVVPIDTSESSFNRLSSVRRSLIHVDFLIKRKKHHKRRNTISDGNSKEIAEALTSRKKSGTLVKTEALIHSSCQTDDDLLQAATGAKSSGRSGGGTSGKRRPEESPSSGELSSSSSTTTETNVNSKPEKRLSFYEAMNFSRLGRDWKFLKKSGKNKEADSGSHGGATKNEMGRAAESGTSTGGSEKKKRSSLLPISTNSGAMTVAVKLRETSARVSAKGGEDGQSSSGNWSASSSTRASVDSDQHHSSGPSPDTIPHSHSESSLGRDSLFSDNTHHSTDGRSHDGTTPGYTSDVSVALTATTLASSWKHPGQGPLTTRSNMNSTSTDQESHSGTITPEACHSDSKSSSSPGTRKISVGSDPFTNPIDDGDSSVYSVDTDGYYTSMHTDSGLKHGLAKFPGEQNGDLAASGDRGSQTSIDTIGNLSLNSFLSQNATDTATDNCSIASTLTQRSKAPPLPPPRLSSVRTLSPIPSQKESSPPVSAGDISESDCEVGERLRRKTSIGSFRYPSICAVSPEPSDEDSCRLDTEKRASGQNSPLSEPNLSHTAGAASELPNTPSVPVKAAEAKQHASADKESDESSARLNMYGVQSVRDVPFLNTLVSQPNAPPTPQPQPVLGSFSSADGDHVQGVLPGTSNRSDARASRLPQSSERKQSPVHAPVKVTNKKEASKSPQAKTAPALQGGGTASSGRKEQMGAAKASASPQTAQPPKQKTPSPTSSPFFLNRPSSLMSKTRSPFLSYLSKNSSPPKTPTTPSPPSPAKSAGRDMNVKQLTLSGSSCKVQDATHSSPEPSSPQNSPQTSPQTTPPAVPPPPPPLTYSSRVLEQGSTRQPSAISDANNDFAQTPSFSRAGARVTLDSEGKVIYSSNSLGRHRDGYTMTSGNAGLPGKCMTLPASMPPTPGSNQRAYVRLDPSGKVETYTSSTIPRTRYSVSGTPTSPDTRPPLLQYRDGMFTLSSPPNSTSTPNARSQFPLSGRSTPQPGMSGYVHSTASGRSTPQPGVSGYPSSHSSGRTTPVQRPASISTPYSSRPSGTSTPISDNGSSGRVTPLHHFSPISVPATTSPGRRTPLQPSPREPVGTRWVSGLPASPPKSSPSPSNAVQHMPPSHVIQAPVPRTHPSGRTTPVHQHSSPTNTHIPSHASFPVSRSHNGGPIASSPVSSWNSGQATPVSRNTARSPTPVMHYQTHSHRMENSAAYASAPRLMPPQSYGHGPHDGHLVNGRMTPVDMLQHNSVNQYNFTDRVNSGRTTLDHPDGSVPRNQYTSYIPRAPYQPSQSLIRGPLGQQVSMSATARGADPRSLIPNHVAHTANGIRENHAYSQGGPLPYGYPSTTPSRHSPVPRSPMSSTRLLAPDHGRVEYGQSVQNQVPPASYGMGPRSPPQPIHNMQNLRQPQSIPGPGHLGSREAYENQRQMPGVYIPNSAQNSYQGINHAGVPMPGTIESPYSLRDLRKEGSPTALSSTSLSSSGSEKSPDSSSSTSITRELAPRKPMSTEDLFAAIHSSKKKHGIRTDTDLAQSPLSSRSSSPLVVTSRPSTPSRGGGGLAETGFLSPRGARDRRSWSGDIAAARVCSPLERRSLANDRLGPAKPTSLLDFKKLLLQTKTSSSQNNLERKSAMELLRPGSGGRKGSSENAVQSLPTSPVNTPSPVESPSAGGQAAWTSTVPLKRGGRSRSSLQHRYDLMYPPILEDCQEEGGEGNRTSAIAEGKGDGDTAVRSGVQTHSSPSSTWV
uniref:Mucin 17 n=1 Tax=Rhipicephalus appendiculatus TaxID=34631 RepID=A0A131YV21_RHIAP